MSAKDVLDRVSDDAAEYLKAGASPVDAAKAALGPAVVDDLRAAIAEDLGAKKKK